MSEAIRRLILCGAAVTLMSAPDAGLAQSSPPSAPEGPAGAPPPDPATIIYALFAARAAQLQTVGTDFAGISEAAANASGLLVADDLVLTAEHGVPDFGGRYQATRIDVRLGSRKAQPLSGTVIARDPDRDLALVQISPAISPRPFCPVAALTPDNLTPPGSRLYVLSYPLDEELGINEGLLRNHSQPKKWQTSISVTVNESGAPAFSGSGYVVGVILGGITEWEDLDGNRRPVFGINAVIPMSSLAASPLAAEIAKHSTDGCWQMLTAFGPSLADPATFVDDTKAGSVPALPEQLSRSFSIDRVKDDHDWFSITKRSYPPAEFPAETGYKIDSCEFVGHSVNNASDIRCTIAADGSRAIFSYTLKSGPKFDRWRGWIDGRVVLQQTRRH
ncbi:serine protease [Sandaracinobacter sp. RS1-74]|uniref:S1 family peptidase n=1 Tax=Sandaracinobacteroides sayramensis TaxID=2913411 RepID=UPI001EDC000F|nr:serine protease [Sandaracinobacteroides sayramensis]MCG2841209.1 serine protease [Sandaracinobacteroides sayramensis]